MKQYASLELTSEQIVEVFQKMQKNGYEHGTCYLTMQYQHHMMKTPLNGLEIKAQCNMLIL